VLKLLDCNYLEYFNFLILVCLSIILYISIWNHFIISNYSMVWIYHFYELIIYIINDKDNFIIYNMKVSIRKSMTYLFYLLNCYSLFIFWAFCWFFILIAANFIYLLINLIDLGAQHLNLLLIIHCLTL
jgi:hypothetical protein